MIMRTIYCMILLLLVSFIEGTAVCEWSNDPSGITLQKEKKKKEKKPFNWEDVRPSKLSGNKDMDAYLQSCDTLWYQIQNYRENMTFFKLDTVVAQDADGNKMLVVKITDEQGNPRNFSKSLVQGAELILNGSTIILEATNISLLTTSATLSLTDNPLLGFTYGKCLKAGPQIAGLAFNEIREIVNATKKQMRDTKSMRESKLEGSTDQAYLLPIEGELPPDTEILNLDTIDLGNSDDEVMTDELDAIDLEETQKPEEKK